MRALEENNWIEAYYLEKLLVLKKVASSNGKGISAENGNETPI